MPRFSAPPFFAVVSLFVLNPAVADRTYCDDDWVCVERREDAKSIEVFVENRKPYPVTVSLRARTRGVSLDGSSTVTLVIDGGHRQRAFGGTKRNDSGSLRVSFDWTVGRPDVEHDDKYRYRLPYRDGEHYYILQGFGSRFSHTGLERYTIDFAMEVGTPVHAARDGVVARLEERHDRGCWEDGCGAYANYIVILHDDGTTGEYYHLQNEGALVEEGQYVKRGQLIGLSGNTGHTTMPHLHFGVYRADTWGQTRSLRVRFRSADGKVFEPRRGGHHEAG